MRAINIVWASAVALQLTGCAAFDRALENRVLCSLDRQQMAVISWWGGLGVGAKIAQADAEVACRERIIVVPVPTGGAGA